MPWGSKFLRNLRGETPLASAVDPKEATGGGEPHAERGATDPVMETSPVKHAATLTVDEASALLAQGERAFKSGILDDALRTFERVADSGRFPDWAAFRIGLVKSASGDESGAEPAFNAAIAQTPGMFWAHFERLRLAIVRTDRSKRDRYAEAILDVTWEPLEPAHVVEIEATAAIVWKDGKHDLAGRLLARLWPSNALSADALDKIVKIALDPALVDAAASRLAASSTSLERKRSDGENLRDHERDHATFQDAVAAFEENRLAEARAGLESVTDAPSLGGWAHYYLGRVFVREADEARAWQAFDTAIVADPALFWAHYERLRLPVVRSERAKRDRYAEAMLDVLWEPLQPAHVGKLEELALAVAADGNRGLAGRLLARMWPADGLGAGSLEIIVATAIDAAMVEAASARLADLPARRGPMPQHPPAPAEDRDLIRERGAFDTAVHDFNAGRLAAAAVGLQRLTNSSSLRGWAHFYLGRIYVGEADQTLALRAFDTAIEADPALFWAHYERAVLADSLEVPIETLCGYVARMCELTWEPIAGNHVRELERIAHGLWDRGKIHEAALLLGRLWPATDLTRLALVRIVEKGSNPEIQRQAADRLHSFAQLDDTALRVLSEYHQRHGDVAREVASLERAFKLKPKDFQTWLGLIRSLAKNGERARALAIAEQGKDFPPKQRLFVALIAHLELGELDEAFFAFRDHCRLYAEVPKFPGIRLAYLLGDLYDVPRRNEVVGILSTYFPGDKDIALVLVNAAMRDQRWSDARTVFDAHFAGMANMPQNVRMAHIDILAFSGEIEQAARLLEAERVDGVMPVPFLRSTIRILSELDRWDQVFEAGMLQLGDDHSFRHFLSPMIRASRKVKESDRLLTGLLALSRPLKSQQLEAIHAVAEDLAEAGDQNVLARIADLDLPFERRHRIELKLRGRAGPAPVEKDLCIYYCADQNYLLPALVSLTALAMSNVSITRRAVFHLVVDADVVPFAEEAGGAIAQRLGLSLVVTDASTIVSSADKLRTSYGLFTGGQQLSLAAYYRIFFARWLVDQKLYAQALYVDADTIVRSGLDELFSIERGVPLLARFETDRPEVRHATEVHQLKGTYFNSGVLRFDLDHAGLPALLDRAIAAAIDPDVKLIFQDQCALNIAFDMNMAQLPDRFNYFNPPSQSGDGISASDAVIVHFLDRPKPWDSLYRRRAREWFEWYDLVETLRQGMTLGA